MQREQIDRTTLFDTADKFIAFANELSKKDNSGTVGTALRYAAARYSAFEASMVTPDLAKDKEKLIALFGDDFAAMLDENFEAYISHMANNG